MFSAFDAARAGILIVAGLPEIAILAIGLLADGNILSPGLAVFAATAAGKEA